MPITTTIVIVPGLQNTTLPGDYSIDTARNILSSSTSGLESMNSDEVVSDNVRTITFSQRTGTKG